MQWTSRATFNHITTLYIHALNFCKPSIAIVSNDVYCDLRCFMYVLCAFIWPYMFYFSLSRTVWWVASPASQHLKPNIRPPGALVPISSSKLPCLRIFTNLVTLRYNNWFRLDVRFICIGRNKQASIVQPSSQRPERSASCVKSKFGWREHHFKFQSG